MAEYDSVLFSPPAPVAFVTIVNPQNGRRTSDILMLVDSGADVTVIPNHLVDELDIDFSQAGKVELAGFDDNKSSVPSIYLNLIIDGRTFRGQFPVVDQPYGIIGRNILNYLRVELNGLDFQWQIL